MKDIFDILPLLSYLPSEFLATLSFLPPNIYHFSVLLYTIHSIDGERTLELDVFYNIAQIF
jgi:hypothetical protein